MKSPSPLPRHFATWALLMCWAANLTSCRSLEPEPPVVTGAIDQAAFAGIDKNSDGKVSPAEMATHKHEEGLAEVDLDNDRRISATEWKSARPSAPPDDETFAKLDLDQDGFLTQTEAVTHITGQTAFVEAFKKMDTGGDGFLHWEEYAAGDATSLEVTLFSAGTPAPSTGGGA